jgi:chorismate mutase
MIRHRPHGAWTARGGMSMGMTENDPVIKQYREQISDNDLKILEALNKRLQLVDKLKMYKDSKGISFVDPAQEDWVITYLSRSNRGPLSREGLEKVFRIVLAVTKEELARKA